MHSIGGLSPFCYMRAVRWTWSCLGVVAFVLWVAGCSDDDAYTGAPPTDTGAFVAVPERVTRGRAIYLRYCALCHGQNGEGYAADHANALTNPAFLSIVSDAFLRTAIEEGRPGTPMSAWGRDAGGPFDSAMVDDLLHYLRSTSTEPVIDVSTIRVLGDANRGAPLYADHCASCHGARGEGVSAVSLANAVFQRTVSDGHLRTTIASGRAGTPMQAWDATLSSQAIDDIVRYVRTFSPIARPAAPTGPPPPDLDHLVIHPEGPAPDFHLRDDRFVPGEEVRAALEAGARMIVLDARASSDWAAGHIPGSAPFPFYNAETLVSHVPHDGTWIVAYCACPHAASGRVVDQLRAAGITTSAVLDEGIGWWTSQGHPVERGSVEP